jgi:CheY-like chemotaxis protein
MNKIAVIIDDNANNLLLEVDLLEVDGFTVFVAENGLDGIALVKNKNPDIIIMDVRLPDMLGTEAIRLLREDKAVCDIPVVFVTASVMDEDVKKVTAIPNSGLLKKPIDTRTFTKEIQSFIK